MLSPSPHCGSLSRGVVVSGPVFLTPMTSRSLGHHLHRFGISSRCLRIDRQSVKGYELADFSNAFTRFLQPSL